MAGETIDNPVQFAVAVQSPRIIPGDTLLLADGVYTGDFAPMLVGTAAKPITIKAQPGCHPIINGSMFLFNNNYLTFQDIEFTFRGWTSRRGTGDWPRQWEGTGLTSGNSPMTCYASNVQLINCVLHDGWNFAPFCNSMLLYGCLIYNNGIIDNGGAGNGHGMYSHSTNPANAPFVIDTCIMLANYNYGWHIDSDTASNKCEYYTMQNTITGKCNGKNIFGSGAGPSKGLIWRNNCTWDTYVCFNYSSARPNSEDITIEDSYFVGGNAARFGAAWFKIFKKMTAKRNTWVAHRAPEIFTVKYPYDGEAADYDFADNDYYTTGTGLAFNPYNRAEFDGLYHTFADWQTLTGLDATSREHRDITPPDYVKLYPNSYDENKANLAVYNWSLAEAVTVDVSSVYRPDQIIRARNAADYYSDYTDLTVDPTGHITLPMTGHTVAVPLMDTAALDGTSFPTFGAFMLEAL